jgi:uncharacterized protein (DUF2062 family)
MRRARSSKETLESSADLWTDKVEAIKEDIENEERSPLMQKDHRSVRKGGLAGGTGAWLWAKLVQPIVNKCRDVFTQGLTPELMALSFAFGFTGGLFPIPGVTTLVCLAFIYVYKLNLAACQLINFLITPLELAMIIPFIKMGDLLFMVKEPLPFSADKLSEMLTNDFLGSLVLLSGSFSRAIVAWLLFTIATTYILYRILVPLLRILIPRLEKCWSK